MPAVTDRLRERLRASDLAGLFIVEMGWDNPPHFAMPSLDGTELSPVPVADKKGVTAFEVPCSNGLPRRSEQHRVVRALRRLSRDQLIVFTASGEHLWLWPEQRPSGVGYRLVDHRYRSDAPTDAIVQRLERASFSVAEEGSLTSSKVLVRVRRSFNAEKVTRNFYREFQKHHKRFTGSIEGIADARDRRWYVSLLLNRLMFVYFVQHRGFIAGDRDYLRNRLAEVRRRLGPGGTHMYLERFLTPLFHQGLGRAESERVYDDPAAAELVGPVPFVNGGIFEPHPLETRYKIRVPDAAFEELFEFFDEWRWHLDERPSAAGNEINPDVLGYIFEQYINFTDAGQKEKGAYYTKPDVTGYMAESAILPAVADRLKAAGLDDPAVLLSDSGDDYMRDSLGHGVDIEIEPPGGGGGSGRGSVAAAIRRSMSTCRRRAMMSRWRGSAGAMWCIDATATGARSSCSRIRGVTGASMTL